MSSLVIDASALIAALAYGRTLPAAESAALHAPTLVDYEVVHILRGLARRADYGESRARETLDAYARFDVRRHDARPHLGTMWRHRHEISAYDASYVALAQGLGVPLLTCDLRLARAARRWCDVHTVE